MVIEKNNYSLAEEVGLKVFQVCVGLSAMTVKESLKYIKIINLFIDCF
jgi:hypothetical protein